MTRTSVPAPTAGWLKAGLPHPVTPPYPPARAAAQATSTGLAEVTWSGPPFNGGSAVTGYVITSTPAGVGGSVGPTVRRFQTAAAEPGVEYEYAVAAVNANGTGPARPAGKVKRPPVGGDAFRYGPNGTEWPSLTPSPSKAPDVIVDSVSGLLAAVAAATSGQVIALRGGTYGGITIPARPAMADFAENVLVRNVPGEHVTVSGLTSKTPSLSIAYLSVTGSVKQDVGAHRNRFARLLALGGAAFFNTSADYCEWVELVATERVVAGTDRFQVKAYNSPPPLDLLISRCWLEGKDYDGGTGHVDTGQWTALAGTHIMRRTYVGAAGNNGTTQIKKDQQGTAVPFGRFVAEDCFFAGGPGQGNSTSQSGPDERTGCVFKGRLLLNRSDATITQSRSSGAFSPKSGVSPTLVNNVSNDTAITSPVFVTPPWWSEVA